jgi:SprA-related family
MSTISGVTASFYQDIYPAAYGLAGNRSTALEQPGVSPASELAKATTADEAQFSPEAMKQAKAANTEDKTKGNQQVSEAEQRQIAELQQDDRRVRAHEQAHIAAGGGLTSGGAKFQYRTGPDGKQYAVGGEVQIDTSEEKDPNATIRKAGRIKAAALAPADPSAQDRSVAASADAMAIKARQELSQAEASGGTGTASGAGPAQGGAAPAASDYAASQKSGTGADRPHVQTSAQINSNSSNTTLFNVQKAYKPQSGQSGIASTGMNWTA